MNSVSSYQYKAEQEQNMFTRLSHHSLIRVPVIYLAGDQRPAQGPSPERQRGLADLS